MDNQQQLNKDRITAAIDAFKDGSPSDLLDAISALTETEKMVVKIIQELTAPPVKRKRSDAGKSRTKPDQRSIAEISRGESARAS